MSTLVILLPPRPRPAPGARDDGAPAPVHGLPDEFEHVLSLDGQRVARTGRVPAAALPRADEVVLRLADTDVAWHRVDVPRAPPARLRAALAGAMEELLLADDEALHLALGTGAVPGQPGWVAATDRAWLHGALQALESAGVVVDRVVAALAPLAEGETGPRGHFFLAECAAAADEAAPWLALSRSDGAGCVLASGSLARAMLPAPGAEAGAGFTAAPAAAAAAERWLGAPVTVLPEAERALISARQGANLRQFDLAPQRRGLRALREGLRVLRTPAWGPVRWGLAALVGLQLVGLNAWAWRLDRELRGQQQAMDALLRSTHPQVRAVLDAPRQMQRETERLRAVAGRAGDGDLETLLAAAAAAWPEGQGPVQTLRYEGGRLTMAAPGWGEPQLAQFRERLRGSGFAAELAEGRVTLAPAGGGAG